MDVLQAMQGADMDRPEQRLLYRELDCFEQPARTEGPLHEVLVTA